MASIQLDVFIEPQDLDNIEMRHFQGNEERSEFAVVQVGWPNQAKLFFRDVPHIEAFVRILGQRIVEYKQKNVTSA